MTIRRDGSYHMMRGLEDVPEEPRRRRATGSAEAVTVDLSQHKTEGPRWWQLAGPIVVVAIALVGGIAAYGALTARAATLEVKADKAEAAVADCLSRTSRLEGVLEQIAKRLESIDAKLDRR